MIPAPPVLTVRLPEPAPVDVEVRSTRPAVDVEVPAPAVVEVRRAGLVRAEARPAPWPPARPQPIRVTWVLARRAA